MKIIIDRNGSIGREAPFVTIDTKTCHYPYAIREVIELAMELDGYSKETIREVFGIMPDDEAPSEEDAMTESDVIGWVEFDWMKIETRPKKYGKYLICRKDGKIHWETWNGSGWAYNHNEIRYWAEINPPLKQKRNESNIRI